MNKEEIKKSIYAEEAVVLYLIRGICKDNEQSTKIRGYLDGMKHKYRKEDSNPKRFLNTLLSYNTILENANRDMLKYNNTNFILPILIPSRYNSYDSYKSKTVLYASFSRKGMLMEDGMIRKLYVEIDLYSNDDERIYRQMCKLTKSSIRIIIEPIELPIGEEDSTAVMQIVENDRMISYIESIREQLGSRDTPNAVFTALENHRDKLCYFIKDTDEYLYIISNTIANLAIAYASIVAYNGIDNEYYNPLCVELTDEDITEDDIKRYKKR